MTSRPSPDRVADAMLSAARKAGADAADAVVVQGTSISVDMRGGHLEHAERAEGIDLGLRVFVGNRQAVVASSDSADATLSEMATRAVAMARAAPEDPFAGLAAPEDLARDPDIAALDLADPGPEPDPAALQAAAAEAEAAALEYQGITQVQQATAAYGAREIFLAATNGFANGYRRTDHGISCVAIAGTGVTMERDYDGDSRIHLEDLRRPTDIGARAAERTLARVGARKPPTGRYPVLFDERVAATLIGHLLAAINGSAVARGASWLKDARGTKVLPDGLDLVEDPHRPRTSGSRAFDGEGLATARRLLIDASVLQGWTLDLATARKLDLPPTGNAARGTSAPPSPANWNVSLTQGNASRADLLRDMGTGLLVTSLIGATINPNTGDYSRGAAGHWVENGEILHPVNECTIAGNLREMLAAIVPANDARPWLSRVVPSLLVPGMTIAGA